MSSSILFQPLPFSRAKKPIQDGLSQLLGASASEALSLCNQCRAARVKDLSCFPKYIIVLSALKDSQLDTLWTNPFNSQNEIQDTIAQAEILNTLWNYICFLHVEILDLNASDRESLKKMKARIGDAMAATEEMELYTTDDEPVFTPKMIDFLDKYHKYLNYSWQLAVIQEANKPLNIQVKSMIACMKAIEEARVLCDELPDRASTFCEPICRAISCYYLANIRFQMGNIDKSALEYGYALASYKEAVKVIQDADKIAPWASQVTATIVCMKNAVRTSLSVAEKENRSIYNAPTNREAPPIGTPQKLVMVIEPTDNLFGHPRNTNPGESYPDLPDVDDSGNVKPTGGDIPPSGGSGGNGGIPSAGKEENGDDFLFELPEVPTEVPPGYKLDQSIAPPPPWNPPPFNPPPFNPGGNSSIGKSLDGPPVFHPPSQPHSDSSHNSAPGPSQYPPWMMKSDLLNQQNQQNSFHSHDSLQPPSFQAPSQPQSFHSNQGFPEWTALMEKKHKLMGRMADLASHPVYGSDVQKLMGSFSQADDSDKFIQQVVDGYLAGDRSRSEDEIKGLIKQADGFYSSLERRLASYH